MKIKQNAINFIIKLLERKYTKLDYLTMQNKKELIQILEKNKNKDIYIKYSLAKKLRKSYNEIKSIVDDNNFIGFTVLGSIIKGKGTIKPITSDTDIDIIFLFKKKNLESLEIAQKALEIICKNTGLQKCSFRNGSKYEVNFYMEEMEEYIKNENIPKIITIFKALFTSPKNKILIRKKIAKLFLEKYPDKLQTFNNSFIYHKLLFKKPPFYQKVQEHTNKIFGKKISSLLGRTKFFYFVLQILVGKNKCMLYKQYKILKKKNLINIIKKYYK